MNAPQSALEFNPFLNLSRRYRKGRIRKIYNGFKTAIASIVLVPPRGVATLLIGGLIYITCSLATLGLSKKYNPNKQPLSRWRYRIMKISRLLMRTLLFTWGFYWIKTRGKPVLGPRAPIVIANHNSILDAMLLYSTYAPCFVAKKELEKLPLVGGVLKASQAILVDRHSKTSREETMESIASRAQFAAIGEGPQVALFPEGTTTNGSYLLNFKIGAFKPGLPVQPVHFDYPDPLFSWTVDNTLWRSLFKIWTNFKNTAKVVILEPYVPSAEEKEDAQLYADNVRKKMAYELNLPMTNHSVEDAFLLMAAQSLHVPDSAVNVQYNELKKLYNLSVDEIKNILKVFASMDKDHSGTLDALEFAHALNLPFTQEVYDLFHLFDQDESGTIDFKEFVLGLSILNSKKELESDTVKYCFQVFDENNDGVISREEFKKIMIKLFLNIKNDDIYSLFAKIDIDQDGFIKYEDWAKFAKDEPGYIFIASDILQKFKPEEQAGPVAQSISGPAEAAKALANAKLNKSA